LAGATPARAVGSAPANAAQALTAPEAMIYRQTREQILAAYRSALAARQWADAVAKISTLSGVELEAALRPPDTNPDQLIQVYAQVLRTTDTALQQRFITLVPRVNLNAAFHAAHSVGRWDLVARHLNGFDVTDIGRYVDTMSDVERAALMAAATSTAHVRMVLLRQAFQRAVASSRWFDAVSAGSGLSNADLEAVLRPPVARDQLIQLYATALQRGDAQMQQRFSLIVEGIDRDAAFHAAHSAGRWDLVARHLNGFNVTDITSYVGTLSEPEQASLAAHVASRPNVRLVLLRARFQRAVAANHWFDAVSVGSGLSDADLEAVLRPPVTHDQLIQLYATALQRGSAEMQHRFMLIVEGINLDAAFHAAHSAGRWDLVARHLNGFSPSDITNRVASLSAQERTTFLARIPPWAVNVRVVVLDRLLHDALAASNWSEAVTHLTGFDGPDMMGRLQELPRATLDQLATAAAALYADPNHGTRRNIESARNTRPGTSIPGVALSPSVSSAPVAGGTVDVHTNVSVPVGGTTLSGLFSMEYQGSQAESTGWIQFIAIEIETFDQSLTHSLGFESTAGLRTPINGETLQASPPSARLWFLDTAGGSVALADGTRDPAPANTGAPFYESPGAGTAPGFIHDTSPNVTRTYDLPSSDSGTVQDIFSNRPNVWKVVERERFHDYLVRGRQVLFRSVLYTEFVWQRQAVGVNPAATGVNPPHQNVPERTGTGPANRILRGQYDQLVRRYPQFAYIPHE
jgi:putative hemolysin